MSRSTYNSLYCQLRRARKLDELMHFLEDPSVPNPGAYSRCVEAGPMLAGWGFAHSASSIWRLYRRHVLAWRMGVAQTRVKYTENPAIADEEIRRITTQRTVEFLAHPDLDPHVLVHLARIELQKDVLGLHKKKFQATLWNKLDYAMTALAEEIKKNPEALAALKALHKAIPS